MASAWDRRRGSETASRLDSLTAGTADFDRYDRLATDVAEAELVPKVVGPAAAPTPGERAITTEEQVADHD